MWRGSGPGQQDNGTIATVYTTRLLNGDKLPERVLPGLKVNRIEQLVSGPVYVGDVVCRQETTAGQLFRIECRHVNYRQADRLAIVVLGVERPG